MLPVFIPPLLLLKDLEEKRDGSSLSLQLPVLLTHLMMLIPTDGQALLNSDFLHVLIGLTET